MAHESFENKEVAAFLNQHFVSVKVDREQHPEVDELYMTAIQIMTGSGGWPLSVFLTPERKPFYGGTYFPPENRFGRPGFLKLLAQIQQLFSTSRDKIELSAAKMLQGIDGYNSPVAEPTEYNSKMVNQAVRQLGEEFDPRYGGFGSAPKFPPSGQIDLLLKVYYRTGQSELLDMVERTLKKMIGGGIFDQLGGGFHRYSTDSQWLIPHFEKMLYDNALMINALLDFHLVSGQLEYADAARKTLDWILRDMVDSAGGFHSSMDADSENEEGSFYLWDKDEIHSILGVEDGELFCEIFGVLSQGNFMGAKNILHRTQTIEDSAGKRGIYPDNLNQRIDSMRDKLLTERQKRIAPGKDDKVLTDWNGLAISAFSRGYRALGDKKYLKAAESAADFILSSMWKNDSLLHSYRDGNAEIAGLLDDYAFLLNGLVDLYQAGFNSAYIHKAVQIAERMIDLFWDSDNGGFYLVPTGRSDLIGRSRHNRDGATPSGNAIAGTALFKLYQLIDRPDLFEYADKMVRSFASQAIDHPAAYLRTVALVEKLTSPMKQVAVNGNGMVYDRVDLIKALNSSYLPGLVIAFGQDSGSTDLPLLENRPAIDDKPTAYYCHDYTCEQPVSDPEELLKMIYSGGR